MSLKKRLTYKQLAEKSREVGGRAPKFDVKYFSRKEVREALVSNRYFTHACVDLGLMRAGSQSPFNAIRNLHKLIHHFGLKTEMLGNNVKPNDMIQCPHCKMKFKMPELKWDVKEHK